MDNGAHPKWINVTVLKLLWIILYDITHILTLQRNKKCYTNVDNYPIFDKKATQPGIEHIILASD